VKLWAGWVSLWEGDERPHVLAAIRILLGLVIVYDFVEIGALGLVQPLFGVTEVGGWSATLTGDHPSLYYQLTPPTAASATALWALCLGCAVCVTIGLRARWAAVVLVLAWAQFRWSLPPADRGIDTLCRNVLLILAASGCGEAWSIEGRWRQLRARVPSWPRRLIVLQIVAMYFLAGVQKGGFAWYPPGHFAALFFILQDPAIAAHDFGWLRHQPFFFFPQVGTAVTVLFQDTYPVVLLLRWWRHTADRPGRLRAWANRYPLEWGWIGLGAFFHVALAATTELGIFPYAMLALYPAFLHPDQAEGALARFRIS